MTSMATSGEMELSIPGMNMTSMDEDEGISRPQTGLDSHAYKSSVMGGTGRTTLAPEQTDRTVVPRMCLVRRTQFRDEGVPIVYGMLNNVPRVAIMIDTGAALTFVSEEFLRHRTGFELIRLGPSDPREATGFEGSRSKLRGKIHITIVVRGHILRHTALVAANMVDPVIVGSDLLAKYQLSVDFSTKSIRPVEGRSIPFQLERGAETPANAPRQMLRCTRCVRIRPQIQQTIHIPVSAVEGSEVLFQPNRTHTKWDDQGLLLPATLATVRAGNIAIPVVSTGLGAVKLPRHAQLGLYEVLDKASSVHGLAMEPQRIQELLEHLKHHAGKASPLPAEDTYHFNNDLTETEAHLLRTLVRLFPDLFSDNLGTVTMTEHTIDTGESPPVFLPRRRYSKVEEDVIWAEVEKLLAAGVIEPCAGPWGAAVVLVKKKDGSWRFCTDYRMLNKVTRRDVYPLPRVDEALDALGSASYFSTMDLTSGFWQIPVAEADRDKTGFLTRRGLFRYTKMPMGLTNSPATFQRLMDLVLRGMTWEYCMVYLDDVVVFSHDFRTHLLHLAMVFRALADAGLRLKPKKCHLGMRSIEYLGFRIDGKGVHPLPRILTAIVEYPVPTNVSEVRSFTMLASFYRRFVPHFASIASPLNDLLKKDVPFIWGEAQAIAFKKLKTLLTSAPCLIVPDFSKTFLLATDAAQLTGMGAALMQDQGQGYQPIAFWSRSLNKHQRNYGVSESECLAVVEAIKVFRPYLYGNRFLLETDHKALTWIMSKKEPAGKLHRWALELQAYDFDIKYRKGSENVVADALSRFPVDDKVTIVRGMRSCELDQALVKASQQKDKMVMRAGTAGHWKNDSGLYLTTTKDTDGIIRVITGDGPRILLPEMLRHEVLKFAHNSAYGGHYMADRTRQRLEELFRMRGLRRHVEQWIRACAVCGARKSRSAQVIPPLRPLRCGALGDRFIVDLLGPFKETPRGNKYIIVVMEYVSRYALACPVASRKKEVVLPPINRMLHEMGLGRELVSDGAGELACKMANELCTLNQMVLTHPMPHRHQMTGLVDRFGRSFHHVLASYVNNSQNDWDVYLTLLLYATNTAISKSLGKSPFEVMFGRKGLNPMSARLTVSEPYSIEYQKRRKEIWETAATALSNAQSAMTEWYKKKVRQRVVWKNGQKVWMYWPARSKAGIGKLRCFWRGPYQIDDVDVGHDNIALTYLPTGKKQMAHTSFLQPFMAPIPLLDQEAELLGRAQRLAARWRPPSVSLDDSSGNQEIPEPEVLERRRVLNQSGKYEELLLVKFPDSNEERIVTLDFKEPSRV